MADIRDVAALAGVSVATVSNVLNGRHGKMRPETLERVERAIQALNFRPSAAALQLKHGRSRTLGLIVPSVANPFWGQVSHFVEKSATQRGYSVLVCNAERDPETERGFAETLRANGVGGIIVASSPKSFEHMREIVGQGVKLAAFDRRDEGDGDLVCCSVAVDQEMGALLATKHLLGLGHTKIGFISGPILTSSRQGRFNGFRTAMHEAGLEVPAYHIWDRAIEPGFGDTEGAEVGRVAIRELLAKPDAPTAVLCVNDMYALGCYAGARDIGLRVPEDVSIVGFDDIVFAEISQPPLTTIQQPVKAMAEAMVGALVRELETSGDESSSANRYAVFTSRLMVRASTTRPSARSLGRSA